MLDGPGASRSPPNLRIRTPASPWPGFTNGHLVLVFNDSETARTPLSIARSVDEGRTWLPPLALEGQGEYPDPSVRQASNGRIHITYTFRRYAIKHVELDENWLTHLSRPN